MVVVPVWQPGAPASVLVGLKYNPDRRPDAVGGLDQRRGQGRVRLASPVASADGSTIYVNGRDNRLWAINTDDGKPKWSTPLKFLPQTPPSVSPDDHIIAGGGPDTKLVAIRDRGDHADVIWTRDDVSPLTTSSRAGDTRRLHRRRRRRQRPGAARVRSRRRPHREQLSASRSVRVAGRGVGRPRPPRSRGDEHGQVYGFAPA